MRVSAFLAFALLSTGCSVDPAPDDVDGLARWFWLHFEDASDAEVADSFAKLQAGTEGIPIPLKGIATLLQAGDVDHVGLKDKDLSLAFGLLSVNTFKCTIDQLAAIYTALDQTKFHPDNYDAYARTYTLAFAPFEARTRLTQSWDVEIKASPAGYEYVEKISGGARLVKDKDGKITMMLGRTWLKEPAVFTNPDDGFFRQDYQIDAYIEHTPGEILHVFAAWREAKWGYFTVEEVSGTQLNGFLDYDAEIAANCK